MKRKITLGSLFSGIGGFEYAAMLNGIEPLWASEKESAPISITKRHFPDMKHLGKIEDINGADITPVDVITFGSPCQDLSIAGKRAGLEGKRSGLFMEAIRIIKEMRGKTNGKYPSRIIWENVGGALSSNGGEDFRIVIEEIANIARTISIPRPPSKDGNAVWNPAGAVVGDKFSLAWRVLDAQYWGVPQRRCRIFLIGDFRGERAGEILFKSEGLSGDSAEGGEEGKSVAGNAKNGFGETGRGYWQRGIQCLRAEGENRPSRPSNVIVEEAENNVEVAIPINTQIATRHNQLGERTGLGIGKDGDPAFTLQEAHSHAVAVGVKTAGFNGWRSVSGTIEYEEERAPCLQATMPPDVVTGVDGAKTGLYCLPSFSLDCRNDMARKEISAPLQAKPNGGQSLNFINPVAVHQNQSGEVRAGKVANNLNTNGNASGRNAPLVAIGIDSEMNSLTEKMGTMRAHESHGAEQFVAYCIQGNTIERSDNAGANGKGVNEDVSFTLNTTDRHAVAFPMQGFGDYKESDVASTIKSRDGKDSTDLIVNYLVRRLTPLECERLMGFPDGWTEYGHDGKKISDSARYKVLGNSVAIPCVYFIMSRISEGE
jgi:DNA (cytosine-5)-methyltransferase 1